MIVVIDGGKVRTAIGIEVSVGHSLRAGATRIIKVNRLAPGIARGREERDHVITADGRFGRERKQNAAKSWQLAHGMNGRRLQCGNRIQRISAKHGTAECSTAKIGKGNYASTLGWSAEERNEQIT